MGERKRRPKSLNSSIAVPEEWIRDLSERYAQSPPVTTFDALHPLQSELVQRLWINKEMRVTATAQGGYIDVLVNDEVLDMGSLSQTPEC